jgi:hypothetical protein
MCLQPQGAAFSRLEAGMTYEDYDLAERAFMKRLKKNNYHLVKPKCCFTCKNHYQMSVEDVVECTVIKVENWQFGVDGMGLCDKYVENEWRPE